MSATLPVYYQIKQTVKSWIIAKEFNPGDKIPSENTLATQFNVSRLTVRQALSQLIQEGFLISKRGEGTFVTNDQDLISSYGLEFSGFMDDLFYQVQKSKTKSVKIIKMTAPRFIQEKLELNGKDIKIVQIKRVRFKGKKPFAYTINHLPIAIGEKIREKSLYEKPLLQILDQDLGISFTEAFQTIEASFASREVSEGLGVPLGSPILFVERIMYTLKRKPVEVIQSSYPGEMYKYTVRLKTMRRKEGSIWVHQDH